MKKKLGGALTLLGLGGLGYWVYLHFPERSAEDALPGDALAIVTLQTENLRSSPLAQPLRQMAQSRLNLPAGCDPLAAVRVLGGTVSSDSAAIGIALETTRALQPCVEGQRQMATPARSVESFSVTEGAADRSVAVSPRGPLLLSIGTSQGRETVLLRMIQAAEGKSPRIAGSPHAALRARLANSANREGVLAGMITLVVTPKLRSELGELVEANLGIGKPALALTDLGAAIHLVGGAQGDVALTAIADCDDAAACAQIREQVMRIRLSLSGKLALRLLGASALIDNVKAEAHEKSVTLTTHDTQANLANLLGRAAEFARAAP